MISNSPALENFAESINQYRKSGNFSLPPLSSTRKNDKVAMRKVEKDLMQIKNKLKQDIES